VKLEVTDPLDFVASEPDIANALVSGGASGWHPTDEALRIAALRDVRTVTFDDAGHMIHWTRPGELASAIASFFAES
jgi:pimeloyl-ACP methyl ester carboxylesterase